jgi:hypothetical protein
MKLPGEDAFRKKVNYDKDNNTAIEHLILLVACSITVATQCGATYRRLKFVVM